MPGPKQQPDHDQISLDDPNEPDVIAFAAADSSEEATQCPVGTHWDGRACVPDDEPILN